MQLEQLLNIKFLDQNEPGTPGTPDNVYNRAWFCLVRRLIHSGTPFNDENILVDLAFMQIL